MLAKLVRLEFKSTYRQLLPLYLVLAVLTAMGLANLSYSLPPGENAFYDTISGLLFGLYVLALIALVVVTNVLIVMRFYKNLLTDQGYLMFTLPATVEQHILAKLIVGFVWMSLSGILFLLSLLALASVQTEFWGDVLLSVNRVYEMALYHMGGQFHVMLILFLISMILSPLSGILTYYLSMAVGQLSRTHKIITSIGAYLGITMGLQLLSSLVTSVFMPGYLNLMDTTAEPTAAMISNFINTLLIYSIIAGVGLIIAFFFLTCYILKNKLNLE